MLFLIDRDGQSLTVDQDIGIMNKWLERIRKITWSYTSMCNKLKKKKKLIFQFLIKNLCSLKI